MLIITRHPNQAVHIDCPDGERITLVMMDHGIRADTKERIDRPAIGIKAPKHYRIVRAELERTDY